MNIRIHQKLILPCTFYYVAVVAARVASHVWPLAVERGKRLNLRPPSSGERGRDWTFGPRGSTSGSGRVDRKERSSLTHAHPLSVNQTRLKNTGGREKKRSSMYAVNDTKEIPNVFDRMWFTLWAGILWGQCVLLELCHWESWKYSQSYLTANNCTQPHNNIHIFRQTGHI